MSSTTETPATIFDAPLDQEDQDAIIFDARAGDLDSLKEIFESMVHPKLLLTCFQSYSKSTPLHMASANGHLEVVQYLYALAKDNLSSNDESGKAEELKKWVNLKNDSGNTALHWACLNGQLDVVKYLCDECDADPFVKNNADHDAIFEAENNGKEEIETYFLKKYDVEPEEKDTEEQEQVEGTDKDDDKTSGTSASDDMLHSVKVTEGTEIANVTIEANEAMAKMKLED
ncbi:hypothetical protein ACO0RG_003206 [Hanseniaspora osmophila]|uniref:Ankyrin repeat-containing protein YAR1 n=1 Tax=Hanseniaspora osmophila TaxID=56408 RepID=A0A1E5RED3_9ASCO|nr:Ankyrin repeat-containing protein YAR1 [Hanseniaspora osmophila]